VTIALLTLLLAGLGILGVAVLRPAADDSAATGAAASPAVPPSPPLSNGRELPAYPVVKVVDGDTLHVLVDGRDETVRIIGINAPETDECWGTEATQAAARLLDGASVGLVADPTQDDRDRYGRLLRYVLLPDGTDVGQRMIADGNADEYTYDNPYANQQAYRDADAAAAAGGRGWWSAATCDGNPAGAGSGSSSSSSESSSESSSSSSSPSSASSSESSSESAPAASAPAQTGPNGCDIKGNISANGKIYHLPGSADYDRTRIDESRGERWFCSVAEAQAAGWRARN
jgi:micrococcal nuclease